MHPLPAEGELVLGSAEDVDVRLADSSISPRAATIAASGDLIILSAFPGSDIAVNGEAVDGSTTLLSGDSMVLGATTIVFHANPRTRSQKAILDLPELRMRLMQEAERFVRYQRAFAVLAVDIGRDSEADSGKIREVVSAAVRFVDIVGWSGSGEFIVVFPETSERADIPSSRILRALKPIAPNARGGLAICPDDGADVDSLLTGARAAARTAEPGQISPVSRIVSTFQIGGTEVVVVDPMMKRLFSLVRDLAKSDIPILIKGETGVGKEIVACAVHAWSARARAAMVSFNCSAVSESLLESELFGHQKGAFTGAVSDKPGLLESAPGGTVFLDEVSESSPRTQAELLRVLETKRVRRVGSVNERHIDVRIVAATNRRLEEEVASGRFRQDLYYRLSAATILIPPLRDRMLDLPVLARMFLQSACKRAEREPMSMSNDGLRRLLVHDWPGNVRELRNLMEYIAAVVHEPVLEARHLPEHIGAATAPWLIASQPPVRLTPPPRDSTPTLPRRFRTLHEEIEELERIRIEEALAAANGIRVRASELLGMPLRTLSTKIKQYGLGSKEADIKREKPQGR